MEVMRLVVIFCCLLSWFGSSCASWDGITPWFSGTCKYRSKENKKKFGCCKIFEKQKKSWEKI